MRVRFFRNRFAGRNCDVKAEYPGQRWERTFQMQTGLFPAVSFFLTWKVLQNLKNCCKADGGCFLNKAACLFSLGSFPWPEYPLVKIRSSESFLRRDVLPNPFLNPAFRNVGRRGWCERGGGKGRNSPWRTEHQREIRSTEDMIFLSLSLIHI